MDKEDQELKAVEEVPDEDDMDMEQWGIVRMGRIFLFRNMRKACRLWSQKLRPRRKIHRSRDEKRDKIEALADKIWIKKFLHGQGPPKSNGNKMIGNSKPTGPTHKPVEKKSGVILINYVLDGNPEDRNAKLKLDQKNALKKRKDNSTSNEKSDSEMSKTTKAKPSKARRSYTKKMKYRKFVTSSSEADDESDASNDSGSNIEFRKKKLVSGYSRKRPGPGSSGLPSKRSAPDAPGYKIHCQTQTGIKSESKVLEKTAKTVVEIEKRTQDLSPMVKVLQNLAKLHAVGETQVATTSPNNKSPEFEKRTNAPQTNAAEPDKEKQNDFLVEDDTDKEPPNQPMKPRLLPFLDSHFIRTHRCFLLRNYRKVYHKVQQGKRIGGTQATHKNADRRNYRTMGNDLRIKKQSNLEECEAQLVTYKMLLRDKNGNDGPICLLDLNTA